MCREDSAGKVRLYCDYTVEDIHGRLWFEVIDTYSDYLFEECGDAFFVALVLLAHIKGLDIQFSTPVSERLHYGVVELLLPAMQIAFPGPRSVSVHADTTDFEFTPVAVGAALSLGVDSFHTLTSSSNGPYPVTHLTFFNSGAMGEEGGEFARILYNRLVAEVEQVASRLELPFVAIDSNIADVLKYSFARTHSIQNLCFCLFMPRLFKVYYYASGFPVTHFRIEGSAAATEYDLLVSKALATESLEVLVSGLYDRRIDKIQSISSFIPAREHLNVCLFTEKSLLGDANGRAENCSRCYKCVKTLVALDASGLLETYSEVFDLEQYRLERSKNLGWMLFLAWRGRDPHATEVVEMGKRQSGFFDPSAYRHALRRGAAGGTARLRRRLGLTV
ncbi:hypothetical protein [Ornithinimicrobium cryptoxanthini]|uniref:hypothetical protein n=1 Tax=Ornithinimicrobium cryptoxanthini TaxID=2934161 RepID=UPI0021192630|nr:hypothetical protein [Ornithinimicrobium cryptoxanthini]